MAVALAGCTDENGAQDAPSGSREGLSALFCESLTKDCEYVSQTHRDPGSSSPRNWISRAEAAEVSDRFGSLLPFRGAPQCRRLVGVDLTR